MKKIALQILALFITSTSIAQIKIWADDSQFGSPDYSIDGDKIKRQNTSEVLYYFEGNQLKKGRGNSSFDPVVLTIDGNKIKLGKGKFVSEKVVFTIDGNKIRQGDGTFLSNAILYTIEDSKVYSGDGTFSSNAVLYSYTGELSIEKLACLLYAVL